jgi:hypothetical protein
MLFLEPLTKINLYDGNDHLWNNFNNEKYIITTISGQQLVTLINSKLRFSPLNYKFVLFPLGQTNLSINQRTTKYLSVGICTERKLISLTKLRYFRLQNA